MPELIVEPGFRSGLLTAREPLKGGKFWLCDCDCGGHTKASKWHLARLLRKSCGCRVFPKDDVVVCIKCGTAGQRDKDFYLRKDGNISSSVCKACCIRRSVENLKATRIRALQHYGGEEPKCACCSESNVEFLALDHINGGGNKHKKENNIGCLAKWLQKHHYPPGFRVLCHNCNFSLGAFGYCPHSRQPLGD